LEIPAAFIILETDNWLVNHRMDSALPGYLMVGSKTFADSLSGLSVEALTEVGPILATVQRTLQEVLKARRVYIGRYGHVPGHSFHFHVIPIYDWVKTLFWNDVRYRALAAFADGPGPTETDGAELTFFVWREFCERAVPPPVVGPSVATVIELLRATMPRP
jgi:diadenosine tetraphosphate (Ap4A) HIT family hydrolase